MIRISSGGDHLTTYFSCFVFSLFWLCFLSWVALKLSGIPGKQLLLFIHFSLIFGLLICFRYGSKQREKDTIKPITPSMIIVGVWYFFILLGCLFNVHSSYLMASILGLWLQLISLTPLGTRGIKLLNQKIKGEF
jgi:accessory gene regulator B